MTMPAPTARISIVAHSLSAGGGISVGRNLIAELTCGLPDARYQIFAPAGLGYEKLVPASTRCEWQLYRRGRGMLGRWLFDRLELTRRITAFAPDIVLCLGNRGAGVAAGKQILLIQDAHFFYPEEHYARMALRRRLLFRLRRLLFARDLRKTAVLLCQTETARRRIRDRYDFEGPIAIMPNAISAEITAAAGSAPAGRFEGDGAGYRLFYPARYYSHKNLEIFLDLFQKYGTALGDVVIYTTIARDQGKGAARFLDQVEARDLGDHIINLGPVAQKNLATCYRSVDALVMPSTLESFSGTYLEAMTFDCPILASDLDFAREICRDAALYFDPWSVDGLFAAIQNLRNNPALRLQLINNGRRVIEQSNRSWQKNAQLLTDIIEQQLQGSWAQEAREIHG